MVGVSCFLVVIEDYSGRGSNLHEKKSEVREVVHETKSGGTRGHRAVPAALR